jgi:uncharacterized protein (DUF2267 family)
MKPLDAGTALEIVLEAVVRRLMPEEADHFIAQLPSLRALRPGPDRAVTLDLTKSWTH